MTTLSNRFRVVLCMSNQNARFPDLYIVRFKLKKSLYHNYTLLVKVVRVERYTINFIPFDVNQGSVLKIVLCPIIVCFYIV